MSLDRDFLNKIAASLKEETKRELNDRVLLVDGLNTFIRSFSVIPTINDNGEHIGGLSGSLKSIGAAIKMFNPTRVIVVFDGKGGSSRRRKIYSEYKANRKNSSTLNRFGGFNTKEDEEESMRKQLMRLGEYLSCLPLTTISIDNIEADDVIAYIAEELLKNEIIIYSTDKDFLQLVNSRISVWRPMEKKQYFEADVFEKFGVYPTNFHIYKSFMNDDSDNIKGVKGIGPKTLFKCYPELAQNSAFTLSIINERAVANEEVSAFKKIAESANILEINNRLVNLKLFEFSGLLKQQISEIVSLPVGNLDMTSIRKFFMEDRLFNDIPDLNSWIMSSYKRLERV